MSSPWFRDNRMNQKSWQEGSIRISPDHFLRDHLLHHHHHFPGCQSRLLCNATPAPEMSISVLIRSLGLKDGDIWFQRRNQSQPLLRERAFHLFEGRTSRHHSRSYKGFRWTEGNPQTACM